MAAMTMRRGLFYLSVLVALLGSGLVSAAELQPLNIGNIRKSEIADYVTWNGYVMEVKGKSQFVLFEENCYLFSDTLVNGRPAGEAVFSLRKGSHVRLTGYLLKRGRGLLVVDMKIIR